MTHINVIMHMLLVRSSDDFGTRCSSDRQVVVMGAELRHLHRRALRLVTTPT